MSDTTTLSLQDKMMRLIPTFKIEYAVKHHDSFHNITHDYVGPFDVSSFDCEEGSRPWVNLSRIASGTDYYDQTTTCQRSNFRRLMADYPEVWTNLSCSNVDGLGAFVDDLTEDIIQTLVKLSEYPLYDEDDHSELESTEITESWDQYLHADIHNHGGLTNAEAEAWMNAEPVALRDAFWTALSAQEYYPEHNGIEVIWDDAQVAMAARSALVALNPVK
jgi:hypothetical protein